MCLDSVDVNEDIDGFEMEDSETDQIELKDLTLDQENDVTSCQELLDVNTDILQECADSADESSDSQNENVFPDISLYEETINDSDCGKEYHNKDVQEEFLNDICVDEEIPDMSQEIRSLSDQSVMTPTLPVSGGHWSNSNAVGDSFWLLDNDAEIKWQKNGEYHSISGAELKERYRIEGIEYRKNEPDFSPLEDEQIGHIELEEFSSDRLGKNGTYSMAMKKVANQLGWSIDEVQQYMDEHGLTWHECGDRRTVQAIPAEINAAFKHTGGIGIEKSMNAVSEAINDQYGTVILDRDAPVGQIENNELKKACQSVKRVYQGYKKR